MKKGNAAEAGRQRRRRRGRGRRRHMKSMFLICMILVSLTGVLTVNAVSLQAKNAGYKEQESELKEQIAAEEQRSEEIDEFKEYVKADEYVKEIAEEKLGLVDPDEIIFKPVQ